MRFQWGPATPKPSLSSHWALRDIPGQKAGDLGRCPGGRPHSLGGSEQIPAPGARLERILSKGPTALGVRLAHSPHVFLLLTLSLPGFMRFVHPSDPPPPSGTPPPALVFSSL